MKLADAVVIANCLMDSSINYTKMDSSMNESMTRVERDYSPLIILDIKRIDLREQWFIDVNADESKDTQLEVRFKFLVLYGKKDTPASPDRVKLWVENFTRTLDAKDTKNLLEMFRRSLISLQNTPTLKEFSSRLL